MGGGGGVTIYFKICTIITSIKINLPNPDIEIIAKIDVDTKNNRRKKNNLYTIYNVYIANEDQYRPDKVPADTYKLLDEPNTIIYRDVNACRPLLG